MKKMLVMFFLFCLFIELAVGVKKNMNPLNGYIIHHHDPKTGRYWSNLILGTGSGTFSKTSMGTLVSGDTIFITDGSYTGGTLSNLTGIVILPLTSRYTMTGKLTLSTLTSCKLKNVNFSSITGTAIQWGGTHNQDDTLQNLYGSNVTGDFTNSSNMGTTYAGTTATLTLYRTVYDSIKLDNCGALWLGSFGQIFNGNNFIDSAVVSRIVITNTATEGRQVNGVFFRLNAHDWYISRTNTNPNSGDVGAIFIFGNATAYRIYQQNEKGYIMRAYCATLTATTRDVYFYDNIKTQGQAFGTVSVRLDNAQFGTYTSACNSYILNNTGTNNQDAGYIAPMLVLGSYPTFHCYVKNNLGINTKQTSQASQIVQNDSGGTWSTSDSTNNKYYPNNVPLYIDTTGTKPTMNPIVNSPIIGAGVNVGLSTDHYMRPWNSPPSIGAVEYFSGLDADAKKFIDSASITNVGLQTAIDSLVVQLKRNNVWGPLVAIYPMVADANTSSGCFTQMKWNLKDPRNLDAAFRITFIQGTAIASDTGIRWDGTTSYADTHVVPFGLLNKDSTSCGVYILTNVSENRTDIGGTYICNRQLRVKNSFA